MIQINPLNPASNILSSSVAEAAAVAFTNVKWPNNPFHKGEVALQQLDGSQESVMSYAPQFIRPFMPEQHRSFYQDLPFFVAAVRDSSGALWATLLEHSQSETVATSPDPSTLVLYAKPVAGDALFDTFAQASTNSHGMGIDIGLLGIQFETARRNRMNGRFTLDENGDVVVHVDQSFGNCPQYIKPRPTWVHSGPISTAAKKPPIIRSSRLSPEQVQWIATAETLFTATGYRPEEEDATEDVRLGNDASHRGGPPGFVWASKDGTEVVWTEFRGNRHFNSLGNLLLDPRIGLTFPNFATGGLLQLTGTAVIDFGSVDQGGRLVRMQVTAVNELPAGSLPVRWPEVEGHSVTRMRVVKVEEESAQVKSFYIAPVEAARTLTTFRAGQHLPIQLTLPNGEVIQRSYSLSSAPSSTDYYRISVKHHAQGKSSSFFHQHMKVGGFISVGKPGGDFVLDHNPSPPANNDENNPIVLISGGIGLTPFLSMVRDMADQKQTPGPVYWFHGVRNGREHALRKEMEFFSGQLSPSLKLVAVYSRPDPTDRSHDAEGRITAALIQEHMAPEHWSNPALRVYLCGPPSFLADLQDGLEGRGVPAKNIFYESF
jgi:uncharacterized protein